MKLVEAVILEKIVRRLYKPATEYANAMDFSIEDITRHGTSGGRPWLFNTVNKFNIIERKVYDEFVTAMYFVAETGKLNNLYRVYKVVNKILEQDLKRVAYVAIVLLKQMEDI